MTGMSLAGLDSATKFRLGDDARFSLCDEIAAMLLGQPITRCIWQDTSLRSFAGMAHRMGRGADLMPGTKAGAGNRLAVTVKGTSRHRLAASSERSKDRLSQP